MKTVFKVRCPSLTITKSDLLNMIDKMPDDIDIDELIYSLYLKKKLELAEKDVANGRIKSHENVVMETEKWFDE